MHGVESLKSKVFLEYLHVTKQLMSYHRGSDKYMKIFRALCQQKAANTELICLCAFAFCRVLFELMLPFTSHTACSLCRNSSALEWSIILCSGNKVDLPSYCRLSIIIFSLRRENMIDRSSLFSDQIQPKAHHDSRYCLETPNYWNRLTQGQF